jgi:Putative prokaryotic signal transducing protein
MLRLYTAANLPDAHLLRQLLAQAGIEAHVFNENAQSGMGEIPFTHAWPEVWLARPGDETRAREIVRGFEQPPAPSPDVFCAECHERNPGNFELCWSCGAALR